MPKYKVCYTEFHTVSSIYSDEFDTSDQDKWESLKAAAEYSLSASDLKKLPSKPPKDPSIWLSLYRQLPKSDYEDHEDDWTSINHGGFDTTLEILDSKGNIIASD